MSVFMFFSYAGVIQAASLSDWTEFDGVNAEDQVGTSLTSVGDIDADGYDDFAVGAPGYDDVFTNSGAVYLIYGDASEYSGTPSLLPMAKFTGEADSDHAGYSVSGVGDVDNDGYDDFMVGAYSNDGGGSDSGAVYLVYGKADRYTDTALYTTVKFAGEAASDQFGYSVSGAGDVDNDGYDDLLIGAPGTESFTGTAYLIYGQDTAYTGIVSLTNAVRFNGEDAGDFAGGSVSAAGYVNDDDFADFLIGSTQNNATGAAYLIYGRDNAYSEARRKLSNRVNPRFVGEADGDNAGHYISSAGDVDNDGYDDFLVGADGYTSSTGAAYLIYGRSANYTESTDLSDVARFSGESTNDAAGSVSSVGDVNHDGYDDFLVGAQYNSEGGVDSGAAYLIYGKADDYSDTNLSSTVKFLGAIAGDKAGYTVSTAGDVNNDGYDDLLVSAEEASFTGKVYLGYLYIDSDSDGEPGTLGIFDGTDCNDNDSSVSANQTYYIDADDDTFGDPDESLSINLCNAIAPEGYVSNNDDENDDDADNDGFSSADDCDDTNSAIVTKQTFYTDSDGDGLGSDTELFTCSLSPDTGYVTNSFDEDDTVFNEGVDIDEDGVPSTSDCDETDNTVSENQTYYRDLDGDGVGGTTELSVCSSTPPTGYSVTNNDCNDLDQDILVPDVYYQDADGDGFGNNEVSSEQCSTTAPDGYVSDNTDDDDTTFGDIDYAIINEDGTVSITYVNTATQTLDPFTSPTNHFKIAISTDLRRLIVSNGKYVKVYRDGVLQASKKVNKTKPNHKLVKLKVKELYASGDTIAVATSNGNKGKLAVLRLTSADKLQKKHKVTVELLRNAHTPVKLKIKKSTHRVTVTFDKKDHKVKQTYKITRKGKLKI